MNRAVIRIGVAATLSASGSIYSQTSGKITDSRRHFTSTTSIDISDDVTASSDLRDLAEKSECTPDWDNISAYAAAGSVSSLDGDHGWSRSSSVAFSDSTTDTAIASAKKAALLIEHQVRSDARKLDRRQGS